MFLCKEKKNPYFKWLTQTSQKWLSSSAVPSTVIYTQAKNQSLEFHPGLPWGPKHLIFHPLPSQVPSQGAGSHGAGGTQSITQSGDAGIANTGLSHWTSSLHSIVLKETFALPKPQFPYLRGCPTLRPVPGDPSRVIVLYLSLSVVMVAFYPTLNDSKGQWATFFCLSLHR